PEQRLEDGAGVLPLLEEPPGDREAEDLEGAPGVEDLAQVPQERISRVPTPDRLREETADLRGIRVRRGLGRDRLEQAGRRPVGVRLDARVRVASDRGGDRGPPLG